MLPLGPSGENPPEIHLKVHKEPAYRAERESSGKREEAIVLQGWGDTEEPPGEQLH